MRAARSHTKSTSPAVNRVLCAFLIYFFLKHLLVDSTFGQFIVNFLKMMLSKILTNTCKQFRGINYVAARTATSDESNKIEKTINQVMLLGRVGGEPQKRGNEQHPVVIFSLATHLNYKYDGGDLMQKTDWHRVCVFKPNLRETVYNYLRKGQRVMVNGRLSYGEIKDDDGNIKTTTSIIADDIVFFQ